MGQVFSSANGLSKELKEYYQSKSKLDKFIDDNDIPELTIDECFVNLTLIEQAHIRKHEKKLQNKRLDSNILSSEDDIEAYKEAINIDNLFDSFEAAEVQPDEKIRDVQAIDTEDKKQPTNEG